MEYILALVYIVKLCIIHNKGPLVFQLWSIEQAIIMRVSARNYWNSWPANQLIRAIIMLQLTLNVLKVMSRHYAEMLGSTKLR